MSESKTLWLRLGCSLQLDDVEARFLLGEPHPYDSPAVQKIIRKQNILNFIFDSMHPNYL